MNNNVNKVFCDGDAPIFEIITLLFTKVQNISVNGHNQGLKTESDFIGIEQNYRTGSFDYVFQTKSRGNV